jgi:hypothetical protein
LIFYQALHHSAVMNQRTSCLVLQLTIKHTSNVLRVPRHTSAVEAIVTLAPEEFGTRGTKERSKDCNDCPQGEATLCGDKQRQSLANIYMYIATDHGLL